MPVNNFTYVLRPKHKKRWLLKSVFLLLFLWGLYLFVFSSFFVTRCILPLCAQAFPIRVEAESVYISPLRGILELNGLSVLSRNQPNLFQCESLRLKCDVYRSLFKNLSIQKMIVSNVNCHYRNEPESAQTHYTIEQILQKVNYAKKYIKDIECAHMIFENVNFAYTDSANNKLCFSVPSIEYSTPLFSLFASCDVYQESDSLLKTVDFRLRGKSLENAYHVQMQLFPKESMDSKAVITVDNYIDWKKTHCNIHSLCCTENSQKDTEFVWDVFMDFDHSNSWQLTSNFDFSFSENPAFHLLPPLYIVEDFNLFELKSQYKGNFFANPEELSLTGDLQVQKHRPSKKHPYLSSLEAQHKFTYNQRFQILNVDTFNLNLSIDSEKIVNCKTYHPFSLNFKNSFKVLDSHRAPPILISIHQFRLKYLSNIFQYVWNKDKFSIEEGFLSMHLNSLKNPDLMVDMRGDFRLDSCRFKSHFIPMTITNLETHFRLNVMSSLNMFFVIDSAMIYNKSRNVFSGTGSASYDVSKNQLTSRVSGKSDLRQLVDAVLDTDMDYVLESHGIEFPENTQTALRMEMTMEDWKVKRTRAEAQLKADDMLLAEFSGNTNVYDYKNYCSSVLQLNANFLFHLLPRRFFTASAHDLLGKFMEGRRLNIVTDYLLQDSEFEVSYCSFLLDEDKPFSNLSTAVELDSPFTISLPNYEMSPLMFTVNGTEKMKWFSALIDDNSHDIYEKAWAAAEEEIGDFYGHFSGDVVHGFLTMDSAWCLSRMPSPRYKNNINVQLSIPVYFNFNDPNNDIVSDISMYMIVHKRAPLGTPFLPPYIASKMRDGMIHARVQFIYGDRNDTMQLEGFAEFENVHFENNNIKSPSFNFRQDAFYDMDFDKNTMVIKNSRISMKLNEKPFQTALFNPDFTARYDLDMFWKKGVITHRHSLGVDSAPYVVMDLVNVFFNLPKVTQSLVGKGTLQLLFKGADIKELTSSFNFYDLIFKYNDFELKDSLSLNGNIAIHYTDTATILDVLQFTLNNQVINLPLGACEMNGHFSARESEILMRSSYFDFDQLLHPFQQNLTPDSEKVTTLGIGFKNEFQPVNAENFLLKATVQFDDLVLAEHQHAKSKLNLSFDGGFLYLDTVLLNVNGEQLAMYGCADMNASEGYPFFLHVFSDKFNLRPITKLFALHPMTGTLQNVDLKMQGRGLSKENVSKNLNASFLCRAQSVSIPVYTDNVWLKLLAFPFFLVAVKSPHDFVISSDTEYLNFQDGALGLCIHQGLLHVELLRFWNGDLLRELIMHGDIEMPSGNFKDFAMKISPTAITTLNVALGGTYGDPQTLLIRSAGSTVVEGTLTLIDPLNMYNFINPWETMDDVDLEAVNRKLYHVPLVLPSRWK